MRGTEKKEVEEYAVFGGFLNIKLVLEESKFINVPQYVKNSCIQVSLHYPLVSIYKY